MKNLIHAAMGIFSEIDDLIDFNETLVPKW